MQARTTFRLSVLASALAAAGAVHALGLGNLTVQSSLGQPLQARIDLSAATNDELETLTAKVADQALYRQNRLAFAPVLSRAKIALTRDAGGKAYLTVTTAATVNEPYLDLLVEVNWASGRVVRDYTFLLDPPGAAMPAAAVEPMTPVRQGSAPARPSAAAAAGAGPAAKAGEQVTVKRGDTLSKIASEVKPSGITLEQMLVAIFKANQGAFQGNMNRLRAGAIISVPSTEDAGATSPTEATQIVRMQASDWRSYRDRVAAGAAEVKEGPSRAATGRIGAAVEEKTPAPPPGRDQLKVSREASKGKAGAAEQAVASTQALRDAQSRITDLEKTVKAMQQALDLKNQTLAQLQTQADAAKGKAEAPKAAPVPPKAPEPPKAAPPAKVEPPKAVEPPKVEPPKAEPPKAVEPPKAEPPKVEPPKAEPPKAPPAPPKAAAPKAPPPPEPSFFSELMSNPWAVGGGALAVLGGIAALVAARRRKTTKFEDSIISGTDIKTNTVFGSTGGGVVNTGENSLATDFSREGLGNIDTDEVDPIAEAEVYLAYGRDAQAEEILKEALKKDPLRQEIHLKLLEIHAQHNKPSAFETVASELYAVSKGQGEVWRKAVALGRQLDPNNPMFAEPGSEPTPVVAATLAAAAAAAPAVASAFKAEPEPFVAAPEPAPKKVETEEGDTSLDFRLDEDLSVMPVDVPKPKPAAEILAEIESTIIPKVVDVAPAAPAMDFAESTKATAASAATALAGTVALGQATIAGEVPAAPEKITPAEAKFDLDFHLDESEKPQPLRPSAPPIPPAPEPALIEPIPTPAPARPAAAIELDKLDLSFDPDKATFEDPTPSVLDGQWHDAATKLDLAKAYQEMGDVEGAREILQEVIHEGDAQQKAEAQALMARLA